MSVKKKKIKQKIFYIGIVLFAVGLLVTALGFNVAGPFSPYQSGSNTYFFPFLNYITLAGIAIAVVTLIVSAMGKKHERKA